MSEEDDTVWDGIVMMPPKKKIPITISSPDVIPDLEKEIDTLRAKLEISERKSEIAQKQLEVAMEALKDYAEDFKHKKMYFMGVTRAVEALAEIEKIGGENV